LKADKGKKYAFWPQEGASWSRKIEKIKIMGAVQQSPFSSNPLKLVRIGCAGKSQSRGFEKLGRKGAICWFQKELSWRLGTHHSNETFFLFQDRKLKFLATV
jgi:hypothetical protein